MQLLRAVFKKIKYELILGVFISVISGILQSILMILFTSSIVHFIKNKQPPRFYILILLSFSFIIFQLLSKIILNYLNKKMVFYLQKYLAECVLNTSYRQFEQEGKSNYYATFTQDIANIAMFISGLPTLLNTCLMALGIIFYLFWHSYVAMLFICYIFLPLFVIYFFLDHYLLQQYIRHARDTWDSWFKALRSLLEGKKELTLYGELRNQFFIHDICYASNHYNTTNYMANNAYAYTQVLWSIANYAVLIGILVFAEKKLIPNSNALFVFFSLIIYVLSAFIAINMFFPVIRRCLVSLKKIQLLTEALVENTSLTKEPVVMNNQNWTIDFKSVCFSSNNRTNQNPFVLGPLSFSIQTSEITFIVGKNGSGKSTLVKILSGLYRPDSGDILLNNHAVSSDGLGRYRNLFAVIFYDFFLFDNLLKYANAKQKERFHQALKDLKINDAVKIMDHCILTESLSDGQRKRLALASAFLYDRPFMVFDEWASDQDPEFKSYFYNIIIQNLKSAGKGVIVISHDPVFFNIGDQLIQITH